MVNSRQIKLWMQDKAYEFRGATPRPSRNEIACVIHPVQSVVCVLIYSLAMQPKVIKRHCPAMHRNCECECDRLSCASWAAQVRWEPPTGGGPRPPWWLRGLAVCIILKYPRNLQDLKTQYNYKFNTNILQSIDPNTPMLCGQRRVGRYWPCSPLNPVKHWILKFYWPMA